MWQDYSPLCHHVAPESYLIRTALITQILSDLLSAKESKAWWDIFFFPENEDFVSMFKAGFQNGLARLCLSCTFSSSDQRLIEADNEQEQSGKKK